MRLSIGYPSNKSEIEILKEGSLKNTIPHVQPVINQDEILTIQRLIEKNIYVSQSIYEFIMDIANKTRQSDEILIGLSTRACLDIVKLARARAFVMGRDYVIPEDILHLSSLTMIHRIIFKMYRK